MEGDGEKQDENHTYKNRDLVAYQQKSNVQTLNANNLYYATGWPNISRDS
jgi:hypothetical protein